MYSNNDNILLSTAMFSDLRLNLLKLYPGRIFLPRQGVANSCVEEIGWYEDMGNGTIPGLGNLMRLCLLNVARRLRENAPGLVMVDGTIRGYWVRDAGVPEDHMIRDQTILDMISALPNNTKLRELRLPHNLALSTWTRLAAVLRSTAVESVCVQLYASENIELPLGMGEHNIVSGRAFNGPITRNCAQLGVNELGELLACAGAKFKCIESVAQTCFRNFDANRKLKLFRPTQRLLLGSFLLERLAHPKKQARRGGSHASSATQDVFHEQLVLNADVLSIVAGHLASSRVVPSIKLLSLTTAEKSARASFYGRMNRQGHYLEDYHPDLP